MITFTKAQCLSVLRQTPRKVLLPLLLAVLSLAALFIPAAEYIQWDNYVGLSFCVLVAFGIVKSVLPESLTAMFANRWWQIAMAIAAITIAAVFFCTDHPRGFFEKPNVIEIYPKEPGFAIRRLEGKRTIIPCTGYIAKGGSEGWQLSRYQSYVARPSCDKPFILKLSTEFIQKKRLSLRISSPTAGETHLRVNGQKERVKVEQANGSFFSNNLGEIQLRQFNLVPISGKRHALIDILQLLGQLCIALLTGCSVGKLVAIRPQTGQVSCVIMVSVAVLLGYLAIPQMTDWINCPDLSQLEPNLSPSIGAGEYGGYKHPIYIQTWWRIAMALIPVRSCWYAFAIALYLLYSSGLLMIGKLLCNLKHQWLAWLTVGTMWQCAYLYLIYDRRVLADYLMLVSAMFAVGCLVMLTGAPVKRFRKLLLIGLGLFSIYTVMVVRHEALGVALALCWGLAGCFLQKPQWARWRQLGAVLLLGTLTCGGLYGFHQFVEQKLLLPIPLKHINTVQDRELRRLLICDIYRIAYCHDGNYAGLSKEVRACINDKLIGHYMTRCYELYKFPSFSTPELKKIWEHSLLTYPQAYLMSKCTSAFIWCKRLDAQVFAKHPFFHAMTIGNDVHLPNGTCGWDATKLSEISLLPSLKASNATQDSSWGYFTLPLPTAIAWASLIVCMLLSGVLLCQRPRFTGVLWLAFIVSSAGVMHLLAWIALPVTILPRYIYWTYCSGTISFCLLLYLIPNVVKCLLKKQSWDVLYDEPTEERP